MSHQNERLAPSFIVICKYPYVETPHQPGTKARPALIIEHGEKFGLPKNVVIVGKLTSRPRELDRAFYHHYVPLNGFVHEAQALPGGNAESSYLVTSGFHALRVDGAFFPERMTPRGWVEQSVLTLADMAIENGTAAIDLRALIEPGKPMPFRLPPQGRKQPKFLTWENPDKTTNPPKTEGPHRKHAGGYLGLRARRREF
jgi:hypothetical protein